MKNYSLRRHIISWITLSILMATLLTFVASYFFARHEVEEVYDAQLVHSAKVLLQLTEHEILEDENFHLGIESPDLQHKYERNIAFRVWANNEIITQSSNAESFRGFEAPPGFSDQTVDQHDWRFFVYLDPQNKIKIEVSERYDIRYELVWQLILSLMLPGLVFIPCIFLIVWIGTSRALKPVVKLSERVDRRKSDDFSEIKTNLLPEEISPLILALNGLLKRIEESFQREREFTDHAAHELRTPLAAMKTQTQVLLKKSKKDDDLKAGLENLEASINRGARMVEQLLSLARLQHQEFSRKKFNLSKCVLDLVGEFQDLASQKEVVFSFDITPGITINGHEDTLSIMIKNLIDNAVKYSPQGGSVSVVLGNEAKLVITDTGPGLSDLDKKRVFERFVRADKTGQVGSGLGLSIAQWIADRHNAQISLQDNENGGLKVVVKFSE